MRVVRSDAGLSLGINTHKLLDALARCSEEQRERFKNAINPGSPSTKVVFRKGEDLELVEALSADVTISAMQRKRLILLKSSGDDMLQSEMHSVKATYEALFALQRPGEPILEFKMMGRWYPIEFRFTYDPGTHSPWGAYLAIEADVSLISASMPVRFYIVREMFESEDGRQRKRMLADILNETGLRLVEVDRSLHEERLSCARRVSTSKPKAYDVTGPAMTVMNLGYFTQFREIQLGTPRGGDMVIVDSATEREDRHVGLERDVVQLPLVRVFIMSLKRWGYVDIDDLAPHVFDDEALDKIVLEPDTKRVLGKLFDTPVERFFGDLLDRRHGGMVICAAGPTGTGKTLTAELYAEQKHRVLYPLELSELGVKPDHMEENLSRVFRRVEAWDAVLLLDEGDVLMARRGNDLQKNAIVAVFLRLLDYYRGVMFITSNRPQDFDEAFAGRITLTLWYPELNEERREAVWRKMLTAAGVDLIDGDEGFRKLAAVRINGRQIRNVVRIAEATDGRTLSSDTLISVSRFTVEGAMAIAGQGAQHG